MKLKRSIITLVLASLAICGAGLLATSKGTPVAKAAVGSYSTSASTFYSGITATSGTALQGQVHDLMANNHRTYTTYDDCKDADYIYSTDPGTSSTYVTDFYTQKNIAKTWGSGKIGTWNREHVWAKSTSSGVFVETGAGADIHHLRPVEVQSNSNRSSIPFGNTRKLSSTYTTNKSSYDQSVSGYYTKTSYEPIDSVKGDVARIIMYVYLHYSSPGNVGGTVNNSYFGNLDITNIMQPSTKAACFDLLLEWNKNDPVSAAERTRNEVAAKYTGTRNAFIDHPEYADAMWGNTPLSSGGDSSSSSSSESSSSSSSSSQTSSFTSSASVTYGGINCPSTTDGTDTLTNEQTGIKTTTYSVFAPINGNTGAQYTGNVCGTTNYIQMRSTNDSGIISSKTGGNIRSVSVDWNSATSSGRIINVYGSNTAYTSSSDLYDTEKQGTLLGTIKNGTTTSLTVSDEYQYVGIRTSSGAAMLNSVTFKWENANTVSKFISASNTKASLSYNYNVDQSTAITSTKVFEKVTSAPSDWTGKYLIVSEANNVALNAGLSSIDVSENTNNVTIQDSKIESTSTLIAGAVDIAKSGSSYSIKTASGKYIGCTASKNSIESQSSSTLNTISLNNGAAEIKGASGYYLCYNSSATRFRYYSSTSQGAVYLYKYVDGDVTNTTTTYTFSDVKLRFGAVLPYSDWSNLLDKCDVTGYGVIAGLYSSAIASIKDIYESTGETVSSTNWITKNGLYHVTEREAESSLSVNRCDESGLLDNTSGTYVKWNMRFDVKSLKASFEKQMTAVAYVIVNGEYVFLEQRTESVKTLATKYIDGGYISNEAQLKSLQVLSTYGE